MKSNEILYETATIENELGRIDFDYKEVFGISFINLIKNLHQVLQYVMRLN